MMKRLLVIAALAALSACGQSGSSSGSDGVMREIEKADAAARGEDVTEAPQRLPSGLTIQFTHKGPDQSLPMPSAQAGVLVHYEGSLVSNGEVFDSSFQRGEPAQFPLQGVVPGFSEAIQHMRPGDELIATIPSRLGYGARASGPIPANSDLKFRIRLIAFREPDGRIVGHP